MSEGFFARPTIFADASNDWRLAREEIFGPVLVATRWEDIDDSACPRRMPTRTQAPRSSLSRMPHWGIYHRMQTVAETPIFSRQADKLFSEDERRAVAALAAAIRAAGKERQ